MLPSYVLATFQPDLNATIVSEVSATEETANETDMYVTCEEVAFMRISSLTFTFAATLFLCYVIVALSIYAHKKKLLRRCTSKLSDLIH